MNRFMKLAILEAKKGIHDGHGGPFGAVIVKDGKVIGKGHNRVLQRHDPTCHGEMMAIHQACKKLGTHDLSGCVIYTTGEPCPMCLGAIMWANIDHVYYGCNVLDTDKIGFRDDKFFRFSSSKEAKAEYMEELDREACLRLYEEYKQIEGKEIY